MKQTATHRQGLAKVSRRSAGPAPTLADPLWQARIVASGRGLLRLVHSADRAYRDVSRRRPAVDAWTLAGFATLVGAGLALATWARATMTAVNAALVATFNLLPEASALIIVGVAQVIHLVLLVAAPTLLLAGRRFGLLARAALAFAASPLLFGWLERHAGLSGASAYESAYSAFVFSTTWPPTSALAAAAGAGVVIAPAARLHWRPVIWLVLAFLAVHRVVTASSAPVDVVLAIGVGGVVGTALLLVLGHSTRILTPRGIEQALRAGGLDVWSLERARDATLPWRFLAQTPSGEVQVKVVDEDDARAARLSRAYRRLRLRDAGEEPAATSPLRAVMIEAMLALLARTHEARVPAVAGIAHAARGEALLAVEDPGAIPLASLPVEEVTDVLLDECWDQVSRLGDARIAHRALHFGNVARDADGQVWIVNLDRGEPAASSAALATDHAEFLAASAAVVGVTRAVAAAQRALDGAELDAALVRLVPAALSGPTQSALRAAPTSLHDLIDEICRVTGLASPRFLPIERVKPRTILLAAGLAVAVYVLAPQFGHLPAMLQTVRDAQVAWIPGVLLASAATYVGAGLGLAASTPGRVSAAEAGTVALASSFVATFTPPGIGEVGLNVRYLQKRGFATPVAVSASAAKEAAVLLAHFALLAILAVWAGRTGALADEFQRLPPIGLIAAVAAALLAGLGAATAVPRIRRLVTRTVMPAVRSSIDALRSVLTSPAKVVQLFAGVLLLPLGYAACLYCSLAAFGGSTSPVAVGLVSLTAGAVATATPIPGGVGAVEAVLIAALTGIGVTPPVALATVFLYRLATFWLPIAPGAVAFQVLTRRQLL